MTVAPLPSPARLRDRALPCTPALASSPIAIVASASSIEISIMVGPPRRAACIPDASRGEPADEGGLLADRADRRFSKIVDLSGQEARDPAGKVQGQIARRIVGVWAGQAIRRDVDERRSLVAPAQSIGVMSLGPQTPRPPFADDQIGCCEGAHD